MFAIFMCLECGEKRVYGNCRPEVHENQMPVLFCRHQGANTVHQFSHVQERWEKAPRRMTLRQYEVEIGRQAHEVKYGGISTHRASQPR